MVGLTDSPDVTSDVYRGHKTKTQQQSQLHINLTWSLDNCSKVQPAVG